MNSEEKEMATEEMEDHFLTKVDSIKKMTEIIEENKDKIDKLQITITAVNAMKKELIKDIPRAIQPSTCSIASWYFQRKNTDFISDSLVEKGKEALGIIKRAIEYYMFSDKDDIELVTVFESMVGSYTIEFIHKERKYHIIVHEVDRLDSENYKFLDDCKYQLDYKANKLLYEDLASSYFLEEFAEVIAKHEKESYVGADGVSTYGL